MLECYVCSLQVPPPTLLTGMEVSQMFFVLPLVKSKSELGVRFFCPSHFWGKHNFPFLLPKNKQFLWNQLMLQLCTGIRVLQYCATFMCHVNTCAPLQWLSGVVWKCSLLFRINSAQGCGSFLHQILLLVPKAFCGRRQCFSFHYI